MNIVTRSRLYQFILFTSLMYILPGNGNKKQSDLIYILEWTTTYEDQEWPYRYIGMGQSSFTSSNCSFQNCFITTNRQYFENVVDYDVLMINAVHYTRFPRQDFQLPLNRPQMQQYLLFCAEPAAYNPIIDDLNDKINLTWTYKLDSDIVHPHFIVKNNISEIIGPKINMHWININNLPPISNSIIRKLNNKRLAAMWMVSNCYSKDRFVYAQNLKNELQSKYGLQLDIFGKCGDDGTCIKGPEGSLKCHYKIQNDYYFYLAFENSNSEDYVSEKVLLGLDHFAVPIVYGGANYSRFLPDGIYLDAKKFSAEGLAKEMYDIINDPSRYYNFFKWHGYYSFHDTVSNLYGFANCQFCAFLNNQKLNRTIQVYENITGWWNVPAPEEFPHLDPPPPPPPLDEPDNDEQEHSWYSNVLDFLTM